MTPAESAEVARSEIVIDLTALRSNARALVELLEGAQLWAVVKGDGYGHGALDVSRAALEGGARALCVATVPEALALRGELADARLIVLGPVSVAEIREARKGGLELVTTAGPVPDDVAVHVKLDTGMGRWGVSEIPSPSRNVVGLMSHLAAADSDPDFTETQIARFMEATKPYPGLERHIANSAGVLRYPAARLDAARCGIALYGISPFPDESLPAAFRPVLSWRSALARVVRLRPGDSTGYGRVFVATEPTWIGVVPIGYADGFRRDLRGTDVLVDGERCPVVGTISMDAFAVRLPGERPIGTVVTLVGDGLAIEEHARVARTIGYEIACGIGSDPRRARRVVADG